MPESAVQSFIKSFNAISFIVHNEAKLKGWHNEERNDGEMIALMHSELSEALEALRHGNEPSDHIKEFSGIEEELADTVIRIMDFVQLRSLDLPNAIIAKIHFNQSRSFKHGNKKF